MCGYCYRDMVHIRELGRVQCKCTKIKSNTCQTDISMLHCIYSNRSFRYHHHLNHEKLVFYAININSWRLIKTEKAIGVK